MIDSSSTIENYTNKTPNSIIHTIKIGIFGLKCLFDIDAIINLNIPQQHKKHVCLFSGNKITYRSMRSHNQAAMIIAYYTEIIESLKGVALLLKPNIILMDDETVDELVKQLTTLKL